MGAAFWIMSSSSTTSPTWLSTTSAAKKTPLDPQYYTLESSYLPNSKLSTLETVLVPNDKLGSVLSQSLLLPVETSPVRSPASAAKDAGNQPRSDSLSDLQSSTGHGNTVATAVLPLEHEGFTSKITKKVVPLDAPQGYDPDARTLTLATWQLSEVPYDPVKDSPAIIQVCSFRNRMVGMISKHCLRSCSQHSRLVFVAIPLLDWRSPHLLQRVDYAYRHNTQYFKFAFSCMAAR